MFGTFLPSLMQAAGLDPGSNVKYGYPRSDIRHHILQTSDFDTMDNRCLSQRGGGVFSYVTLFHTMAFF